MASACVSWLQPGFLPLPPCIFWVPNGAEQEWLRAGEAGEREGKRRRGSPGLPQHAVYSLGAAATTQLMLPGEADALPCATLASIYPRFFQCPPRSFRFSCIQIFAFCLFVQFSIASLKLVDSHPWWGKPFSSASPGRAEPCPSTHHPFSSPEHTS